MRFLLVACAALALSGCDSDPCGSEGTAEIMAQKFVKRELRDPDSAKFTQTLTVRESPNSCSYLVRGRFSAKNGFGGMTGGVYIVEMRKAKGQNSWSAVDLVIQ